MIYGSEVWKLSQPASMYDQPEGIVPYASRTGNRSTLAKLRKYGWRLMLSARNKLSTEGFRYALDNGAWTSYQKGEPFNTKAFERALDKVGYEADFITVPDIVAEGAKSLAFSLAWLPDLYEFDRLLLIPVQDGMVPRDLYPHINHKVGLFVGGTAEWKEASLPGWANLAHDRDCYLHVGRVNSRRRLRLCAYHGVHSFDGSGPSRYPQKTLESLQRELRQTKLNFGRR